MCGNNLFYGILFVVVILLIIKLACPLEAFSNTIPEYEKYCGPGTKIGEDGCVVDEDAIVSDLIDKEYIKYTDGKIQFLPENNVMNIEDTPDWYKVWLNNRGYSGQRVISWGICGSPTPTNYYEFSGNCGASCRCSDCAGWRGGNTTDCNGESIGSSHSGRVSCLPGREIQEKDASNLCQCEYGYTAVNGLCVSPFELKNTTPDNRCCPKCALYKPDPTFADWGPVGANLKQGGCGGLMECDPNNLCEEAIVSLPGKKINIINHNGVNIINTLCSETESNDCYDPNSSDARKRQPYVVVDSMNLIEVDTNTAEGENEYECAMKCESTLPSNLPYKFDQVGCSKRCLPKLWRWYPVFEKMEDTGFLRYTGGYYQSDELMRYLPSNNKMMYCPDGSCETEENIPDIAEFNNCVGCDNCRFIYKTDINSNGVTISNYICDNCDVCYTDKENDLGLLKQFSCKDMMNCDDCIIFSTDMGDGITSLENTQCDKCGGSNPFNEDSGCKVFTLDPYELRNGNVGYHPGAITYNRGGDNTLLTTNQYNPNSRSTDCGPKTTCDNTINGKIGWGDGSSRVVENGGTSADCTTGCGSFRVGKITGY